MASREKITFRLEKDEDGYPPNDYETLWAEPLGAGKYRIDNAPFFVPNISSDDIVYGERVGGITMFSGLVRASGNSVVRVIFLEDSIKEKYIEELMELGCYIERSHLPSLIVFEIPSGVKYKDIKHKLEIDMARGLIDYEEAALRHCE